ncbi:MAG: transglutaminase domain-containing protein [Pirellulales bacterium]
MLHRRFAIAVNSLAIGFIAATANAGEAAVDFEAALKSAGDNRAQIEAAFENTPAEQKVGMRFLVANMPAEDLRRLSEKFLLANVEYAYRAWYESPWKDRIPNDVFLDYLLPYAVVDERRDDWRKDFYERFKPLVADIEQPGKARVALNQKLFPLLKVRFAADRAKANQSPYETIEAGNASCTGLSILLVDACRAVGVPARLAGTPLWVDKSGNHSWVEIWDGDDWHFTGAAEPAGNDLDKGWFAGRATTAQRDDPLHAIYAARFERSPLQFPSAWSRRQRTVYAVNVTDRYTQRAKPRVEGEIVTRFRVLEKPEGPRIAAKLRLTDGERVVAEGVTRDDQFDPNDHLEAVVPREKALRVQLNALDRQLEAELKPAHDQELFTYNLSDAEPRIPGRQQLTGAERTFAASPNGRKVAELAERFFAAAPEERAKIDFDPALDALVLTESAVVRKLVWRAYLAGREAQQMREELSSHHVRYEKYDCPYIVRAVGSMPADGWPLVIAMHGGGGAPAEVNDSQWKSMQHYYRDQPSVEGYLYLAIRAPNNTWNGFYDWYNLGLTDRLIRQFTAGANVDPNKVFLIGYSHGGYGAFFIGARMPDRFAAIQASAAAPTGGNVTGKNLRNTPFTFMVGEHDLAYSRLSFCREFDKYVSALRGDRRDIYPVAMEFKEGYQHSGLPDRDKIKDLYPAVRNPAPRELSWALTNREVDALNWLHVPEPVVGAEIDATCRDNAVSVKSQKVKEVHVLLDERLVDFDKSVAIDVNGHTSTQSVTPSLRTLCETLAERGDPEYAFATRLTLHPQTNEP